MAATAGLVQRLTLFTSAAMACVWIGPTPTNTEAFFVLRDASDPAEIGAFESSIVDALVAAITNRREIVVVHGDNSAQITSLRIEPA